MYLSPFRLILLSAWNVNKLFHTRLFKHRTYPKESLQFQVKHLCQWPQGSLGSQVKHGSAARFSLSASQAIPVISSASLRYCFAYRKQIRLEDRQPTPQSPSLLFEEIDSIFGSTYAATTSCSKIRAQQQESTRGSGLSIPGGALLGPHSAARCCFRVFKITFSCNILPRAVSAVGACQSSQPTLSSIPGALPPWKAEKEGAVGARWSQPIPSCTRGAEAMGTSQGSGSETADFR